MTGLDQCSDVTKLCFQNLSQVHKESRVVPSGDSEPLEHIVTIVQLTSKKALGMKMRRRVECVRMEVGEPLTLFVIKWRRKRSAVTLW